MYLHHEFWYTLVGSGGHWNESQQCPDIFTLSNIFLQWILKKICKTKQTGGMKINTACRPEEIAAATTLVPYPVVKTLELIWRLGTRRWNLCVPNLLMSCSDLISMIGHCDSSTSNSHQGDMSYFRLIITWNCIMEIIEDHCYIHTPDTLNYRNLPIRSNLPDRSAPMN